MHGEWQANSASLDALEFPGTNLIEGDHNVEISSGCCKIYMERITGPARFFVCFEDQQSGRTARTEFPQCFFPVPGNSLGPSR